VFEQTQSNNCITSWELAAVTSSCKALTDNACSMTKTHCDKSGGIFYKKLWKKIIISLIFYLNIWIFIITLSAIFSK